ncbi:MAG: hypothetical protein CSA20_05435 [Deltaproteobacteria bacterium]|nr:MAG: hypothetical protein CSB23_03335 [Deltaproteobacteria bacterium]PIE72910.1 MAG: hypothetical protein CSA20_05435 [Deltaproteobacteria bacterium]
MPKNISTTVVLFFSNMLVKEFYIQPYQKRRLAVKGENTCSLEKSFLFVQMGYAQTGGRARSKTTAMENYINANLGLCTPMVLLDPDR